MLWADKYKPTKIDDLVGNSEVIKKLKIWLKDWDSVKSTKSKTKAVLLSGPPGIGKTTSAFLIGKQLGFKIFEMNASDTRSKKIVEEMLQDVIDNQVLNFNFNANPKRLIIMDEVDGMSSSDRGGIAELIKIIKNSKIPIICICNDRQKTSVRSLANYCLDLRFIRPELTFIFKRMKIICTEEELKVDNKALENMIKSTGNDVRQILNILQLWRQTSTKGKDRVHQLNSFDSVSFIFNKSHKSTLDDRFNAFFIDYDLIPLMISENYINSCCDNKKSDNKKSDSELLEELDKISKAANAVCDSDICDNYIRNQMSWDLLEVQAILNIRIAYITEGNCDFPGFPEWLGKNSNATKRSRLLNELSIHVRKSTNTDRLGLRLDYVSTLREILLKPLLEKVEQEVKQEVKKEKCQIVINILNSYGMNNNDFFITLQELQFSLEKYNTEFPNKYELLDTQTKSTFTRLYNQQNNHQNHSFEGNSKKRKIDYDEEKLVLEEEDLNEEEEEIVSDNDISMFKSKNSKLKKSKKNNS